MKCFPLILLVLLGVASVMGAPQVGAEKKEPPKRTGKVYIQVFQKENFKGPMARVPVPAEIVGSAKLKELYIANDSVMSLKIPEGVVVTLYDGDGFGGQSESFTGNVATVGKMKGLTSSMKTAFVEIQKESFAKDLTLAGWLTVRGDITVILVNTKTREYSRLRNHDPAPNGMKVKSFHKSDDRKETQVELELNGETREVRYNETWLKKNAPPEVKPNQFLPDDGSTFQNFVG